MPLVSSVRKRLAGPAPDAPAYGASGEAEAESITATLPPALTSEQANSESIPLAAANAAAPGTEASRALLAGALAPVEAPLAANSKPTLSLTELFGSTGTSKPMTKF